MVSQQEYIKKLKKKKSEKLLQKYNFVVVL
jgi:hypothetical protein